MREPLDAEGFAAAVDVSRETLERLKIYADLLLVWGERINLIGKSTAADLWRRHMLDSAQLWAHLPPTAKSLLDLGSGAGFPGLVLAIMGAPGVRLIESNSRKCAFLREAARRTQTAVTIHPDRIEAKTGAPAAVITARALAPLPLLLEYSEPYLMPNSICLFLKGRGVDQELTELRKTWNIREVRFASLTDPDGVVLRLEEISRGAHR